MRRDRSSEGWSPWPSWLIAVAGTWLVAIVALTAWAGETAAGRPSREWTADVIAAAATLAVGWILATRHAWTKTRVLAFGGGVAWGGTNAASVLTNSGPDPLPWAVVVLANVAVGLVIVPVVIALGAGARLALDRVFPG